MDALSKLLSEDFEKLDYVMVFKKNNEIVLYDFKTNSIYANYKIEEKEDLKNDS